MSPTRMSKIESATRSVLALQTAFNRRDLDVVASLLDKECLFETASPPPDGKPIKGRDAIIRVLQERFEQTADLRMEIEEIFGMGQRCILRTRLTWTDAARKANHLRDVEIFKVMDGLITEIFSYVKG